jgi:ABC-type oligopeptide transport system ATPase subunit
MSETLLEVRDLVKVFPARRALWQRESNEKRAVDGVSFSIAAGDTLALVGESGCGKTTTGRCVLRLIEPTSGIVRFAGFDVRAAKDEQLRALRRQAQMIFQDPGESLTPWLTVGALVGEGLYVHNIAEGAAADQRVRQLLEEVGLRSSDAARYPEELSGGQRQRVAIARALAVQPRFLVCDEAVSALDVSVQAQVLNLLLDLRRDRQLTYLFIAHNLAVVQRVATHVAVMNKGRVVEIGLTEQVFNAPQHEWTQTLLSSMPKPLRARR